MQKKFGVLSSSTDPNELAKTVEGIIIGLSALIIYGAHTLGLNIGTDQISLFAAQIGAAIGSSVFLFGLIRKAVVFFSTKLNPTV